MKKRPSNLPVIVLSGASGFIGSEVLNSLKEEYYFYALARRSQKAAGIPVHPNILWIRVDIANEPEIDKVFTEIVSNGGADYFIHLAGFYDFENKPNPEYTRTNVVGTRIVLQAAVKLNLKRFVFASSLATIKFFDSERLINEHSISDAEYPYARSKQSGEKLVKEYSKHFPCTTIRLAAIFSDWCEYLPLYWLLTVWLSNRWDRRLLVGQGTAAIPYLHITDLISLFNCVLKRVGELPVYHILNASPRTSASQRTLFKAAHHYSYFHPVEPVYIPKWFAAMGIIFRNLVGKITGNQPFERLWMMKYVDKQLIVDSIETEKLVHWKPTKRLGITRRLLFLIAKMKSNPFEWHYKNKKRLTAAPTESQYLKIYEAMIQLKEEMLQEIIEQLTAKENAALFPNYQKMSEEYRCHCVEYIFKMLETDIRTGERSYIMDYGEHLAEHRFFENFPVEEVVKALQITTRTIVKNLVALPALKEMKQRIIDEIAITLQMVIDEVEDTYARLSYSKEAEK